MPHQCPKCCEELTETVVSEQPFYTIKQYHCKFHGWQKSISVEAADCDETVVRHVGKLVCSRCKDETPLLYPYGGDDFICVRCKSELARGGKWDGLKTSVK